MPGRRLVVTGCLPQRHGAELLTEMPEIDALVGTGELPRIVDVVRRLDARDACGVGPARIRVARIRRGYAWAASPTPT